MTILEFIRKNSLLVLIVIVALGLGLLMMDYGGKSSLFSNNYYFKVNGTSYDFSEAENLGSGGLAHIHNLSRAAFRKLNAKFDVNQNDTMEEAETAARTEWLQAHPEYSITLSKLDHISQIWAGVGIGRRGEDNVAINRAILHDTADRLGIRPSNDQIDAYIRNMPFFINDDGSFDVELYRSVTGYRDGVPNTAMEQGFRSVIADIMIWEILENMLTSDAAYYAGANERVADMMFQRVSGRTVWLPISAVSKPEAPTEEEVKAYWDAHHAAYQTPERRVVTVYTLSVGEGSNPNDLSTTASAILQEISAANGQGLGDIIRTFSEDPQVPAFTYTVETTGPCTLAEPDTVLSVLVEGDNNSETPLVRVAFADVDEAPSLEAYEKAKAEGTAEQLVTLRQIPGYYYTKDNRVIFVRVEAIEAPRELTYEEAHDRAVADATADREANAVQIAATKLYNDMNAALPQGAEAAFAAAEAAGAKVDFFGPVSVSFMEGDTELPEGLDALELMCAPKGKLMEPALLPQGIRISMVELRTVEESPMIQQLRQQFGLMNDYNLRTLIMADWLISTTQTSVTPSKHLTGNGQGE